MKLALTLEERSQMKWEAGNGRMNIYSLNGEFLTSNPKFDDQYIVDEHNPKILIFNTINEAIAFINQ